jgi:hypothetical protein
MIFIKIFLYRFSMRVWRADYNVSIRDANESPLPSASLIIQDRPHIIVIQFPEYNPLMVLVRFSQKGA